MKAKALKSAQIVEENADENMNSETGRVFSMSQPASQYNQKCQLYHYPNKCLKQDIKKTGTKLGRSLLPF
ncbi:MAG: hypothetical protein ACI3ZK_08465 [Candidatus Cryptobacteroides sp.]